MQGIDKAVCVKEYDIVSLPDGRTGHIIETFKNGDVLVEFETPEGSDKYDDEFFKVSEVKLVNSEAEVSN